jgi:hypothetical protein
MHEGRGDVPLDAFLQSAGRSPDHRCRTCCGFQLMSRFVFPFAIAFMSAISAATSCAAASRWRMAVSEEDWGKGCTLSRDIGDGKQIGFQASPGQGMDAFVDLNQPGLRHGTWRVDDNPAYELSGSHNDYFGFPTFWVKSEALLAEIARGKSLTIAVDGAERVTVDLAGATEAVAQFLACWGKR